VHSVSFIEGMSIAEVGFEQRKLMLLGIISANPVHQKHKNSYPIKNQHFYFNPEPYFVLRESDLLVVIGREYAIGYFREQIEKSRLKNGRKKMKRIAVFGYSVMSLEAMSRLNREQCSIIFIGKDDVEAALVAEKGFDTKVIDFRNDDALRSIGIGTDVDTLFLFLSQGF